MRKRKFSTAVAGVLALAVCTGLAHAQSDPTAVEFPIIGIGFNQTLQVNVITFPPNPCAILVTVYSATGEVIIAFEEGDPDKPLQLGKLVSSFPQRAEVRAEVTLTPSPATSSSVCAAQATAEIIDNFTKTAWVVAPGVCYPPGPSTMPTGPAFCPGPNVIPPGPQYFGPVGLTFEQTARLNAVAPHPPDPCIGTLGFIDPRGIAIIPPNPQQGSGQKSVNLAGGQSQFLDLTGLAARTATGRQRPEVVGVFMPTTAPQSCIASLEVFDRLTGWTRIFYPPGPTNYPPGPAQRDDDGGAIAPRRIEVAPTVA
jgi:hypothetical protein